MRIQKRFLLSITASLAISLFVTLSVLSILQDMERKAAGIEVYREIEEKTNALSLSIARYPSRPEAGRIQQIKASRASLQNLLGSLNPHGIVETALIRHISTNTHELEYLLEKLISGSSEPAARERQNVLISHLRMKSQFILDDTQRLMEINQSQINAARNRTHVLIVSLIVALVLMNTAISLFSSKSILRAQEDLRKALDKAQEGERLTRQSQYRLIEAQRLAKLGDWEWDPIKDEVSWSQAMYDIFGRSPELSPPTYLEHRRYYTRDSWARLEESVKRALESGKSYELELEHIREDETTGWQMAKGEVLLDHAGNTIKLRGTAQDITTRKLAENALRKSEERFRALMSASSEVLYTMNPDWSEMRQLHGHGFLANTETANPNWLQEYIHPDDRAQVTAAIDAAIDTKSPFGFEHRVRRADGTWGWTSSRAVPLFDANGEVIEWFGAASDITKRKKAEQALRESEELFRIAVTAAKLGIYSRDLQTGKNYWSPEFLSIYGYDPDAPLPLRDGVPAAVHPEDVQAVLSEARARLHRTASPEFSSEHRIVLPDGEVRWVMLRGRVEFDSQARPLRTLGLVMDITERKRAEEALRISEQNLAKELEVARNLQGISIELIETGDLEELYEKILDTAVAILKSDFASIQILHPERGTGGELRLLGYRGFTAQAAKLWEWVSPASQSACGYALCTNKRVVVPDLQTCDFVFGSADMEMYLQTGIRAMQTTPLVSRSGVVLGMLSTHWREPHDMTAGELRSIDVLAREAADLIDRKKAEDELLKSQARLRAALQIAQLGVWEYDPAALLTRFDDRCRDIFGIAEDRAVSNEEMFGLIHPEDRARVKEEVLAVLAQQQNGSYDTQYRIIRPDGKLLWVAVRGNANTADEGTDSRSFKIIGTAMDITERKNAEEELARTLAKAADGDRTLDALMEHVPEGITIADAPDVRIRRVSRYGVELTDKANEVLTGIPVDQHAEKWDIYEADGVTLASNENMPLTRATKYGEVIKDKEYILGNPKSHRIPILCNAAPIIDQHGKITGGIIAWRDITDRKKAEEALRQWSETLEQRVAERTALAEKRAIQLQSLSVELIEAEERERRRIAQLLHEGLQQDIAAARFQLQAFRQDLPPEPALVNVEKILVESIAKSRRITHELSPPMLEHSSLDTVLQWLVRHMGEQFGLQVELEVKTAQEFNSEPVKIFIFRALQELLFNVYKHSGVNSAKVRLSHQDDRIVVMVSDQGRGFDLNILDSTIVKDCFGLLSLRERASYIGGNFLIQSAPGQGSRIILSVPFSLPPMGTPETSAIDGPADTHAGEDSTIIGTLRVLLVDDHKVMRQGLTKLISGQANIEVVGEAANGLEAIELTRRIKPHVIVMDISMPEMDGVEATRIIKGELPEVRVIGLSMFEDETILRAMLEARAETLLSKTSSSAELIRAIYGTPGKGRKSEEKKLEAISLDLEQL